MSTFESTVYVVTYEEGDPGYPAILYAGVSLEKAVSAARLDPRIKPYITIDEWKNGFKTNNYIQF